MDTKALYKFSYGLFLLSVKNGDKDNACIINTGMQVTSTPLRISITVNKQNLTTMMLERTKRFTLSVLSEKTPFSVFERFGLQSGMNVEKFPSTEGFLRDENGILYDAVHSCAYLSAEVEQTVDLGTHVLFIARPREMRVLSEEAPMTYAY